MQPLHYSSSPTAYGSQLDLVARVEIESTASLVLSQSGLPIAYRAMFLGTIKFPPVRVERTAYLGLNKSGRPIAYRAKLFMVRGINSQDYLVLES